MRPGRGRRRWVTFDALLLFRGITMLVNASFASVGVPALGGVFLGFIALIGLNATVGFFDSSARGQTDMTYDSVPAATRFRMSHLYGGFLWGPIIFGVWVLLRGPADGPAAILDVLTLLSTFAVGAYCIVLLLVNNRLLPTPFRPTLWTNLIIGFGAFLYLGMLLYSLFRFGVVVG